MRSQTFSITVLLKNTHADIGPHHRWASGTLYDNIVTDGRNKCSGPWQLGHRSWLGRCYAGNLELYCQSAQPFKIPGLSGKNYCIGLKGDKYAGRLGGRMDGEWEGQNKPGLHPGSLYLLQLKARKAKSNRQLTICKLQGKVVTMRLSF